MVDTEELGKNGYVVVRGAIGRKEALEYKKRLLTAWEEEDCVSHSKPMWDIRCEEGVRKVFEEVWDGEKDLITSFDGASFKRKGKGGFVLGYHVDQEVEGKACYQGVVALTDSNERTGTTCVLPRSHLHHSSFRKRKGASDEWEEGSWQFLEVEEGDPLFRSSLQPTPVHLSPGDVLLFDSRLAHRVLPAEERGEERVVAYVSMVPRKMASKKCLRKRVRMAKERKASTHWPHLVVERGDSSLKSGVKEFSKDMASLI